MFYEWLLYLSATVPSSGCFDNKYISKKKPNFFVNQLNVRAKWVIGFYISTQERAVLNLEYILEGNSLECESRPSVRFWGEKKSSLCIWWDTVDFVCLHCNIMKNEKYRIQMTTEAKWAEVKSGGHQSCRLLLHASYTNVCWCQQTPKNTQTLYSSKHNFWSTKFNAYKNRKVHQIWQNLLLKDV